MPHAKLWRRDAQHRCIRPGRELRVHAADTSLAGCRETLPKDEVARYEAQYRYIRQICALYEDDPGNFNKLFSLIQEVRRGGWLPGPLGCMRERDWKRQSKW